MSQTPYKDQLEIISKVYNNSGKSKAHGLERKLKIFLLASKFVFPAFHISSYFGKQGQTSKDNAIEFYVFFKLVVSVLILYLQLYTYGPIVCGHSLAFWWILYMTIETLSYPATLIFCRDFFPEPSSFNRDILFVFIDYTMVVLDFASLYLMCGTLCTSAGNQVTRSLDALYFSFASAFTIGYGDITVSTDIGKWLVIIQAMIFLTYGVLFLNFYASNVGKGKNSA